MTKNIYTILNILAIGAIIFMGVDTSYRILKGKLDQPVIEKTSVIKRPGESKRSRVRRLSEYEVINRRSIFGKSAEDISVSDENLVELENLDPTSLNISLLGTSEVNKEHKEDSVAIISVRSKRPPEGIYHIGDSVEGALITNILRNKVILRINGKDEILEKDEDTNRTGTTASPSLSGRGSVTPPPTSTSPLTRNISLKRDDVEDAMSDIQNLLTQASITPHFTNGEPDGLAITGVKTGSIFRRMGLRNGDILKSVEGNEIRSADDLMALYNDLQSEEEISFEIIRRGRERTNVLQLK